MDSLFSRTATLFYITTLIINSVSTKSTSLPNTCVTPTCVRAAADILEAMDPSVNPCDDFYKFTCGQFLNSTYTRYNQLVKSSWKSGVYTDIVEKLGGLLNSKISKNDIEIFKWTKQLYKQCVDRKTIIAQEDKNILDFINKFGGWPVVMGDNWNSTDIDWIKTPAIFSKANSYLIEGYFLSLKLTMNKNLSKNFIEIQPMQYTSLLSYPVKNFNNYSDNSVYYNFLVKFAVKLGADEYRAKRELMEAIKFESDLLQIVESFLMDLYNNKLDSDNFMTIDEMMKKWPTIDWLNYFNNIYSMSSFMNKIEKNETVIVNCPDFITNLEDLINSTSKRILINYAFARIVVDLLELTDPSIDIFSESKQIKINDKNIWRHCVMETVYNLPEIVTALYVRNYIKEDVKIEATNIVSNIKTEIIKMINETKWLDEESKIKASQKILSANSNIGYPDLYRNDKNITEFFRDLQLGESTYLHNLWKISRLNVTFIFRNIRDDNEYFKNWISLLYPMFSLNALYDESDHVFTISPDYLQRPSIDTRQPAYINYGRIGFVIGHELIHVIDRYSQFIDEDSTKNDSLIKSSKEEFLKRVDCLINQHNNYTVEGFNGNLSQHENIADNVGIRMSYSAYKNWSSLQHEPEPSLPGLNYSPSQMFWINYANGWCSVVNPDMLIQFVKTDSHSLPEFRVLNTLSNIPEFSKDFNCPQGSPMNPEKKCKVW
ncbi:hypothetical protein PV326_006090 [Microctonus aethiopoides]|nr:hypothetical protein PV326_006090 [Microctonus aethiopoides]